MWITPALAQAGDPASGGSALVQFVPFLIIIAIMYFLIIRPQQNRLKEHRAMVAALRRGDTVVTAGGLIGKVAKVVSDTELVVELAEGVRVRVVKGTISEVRSKTEPVRETSRRDEDEEDEAEDDADHDEDRIVDANYEDAPKKEKDNAQSVSSSSSRALPSPNRSAPARRGKQPPPSKRPAPRPAAQAQPANDAQAKPAKTDPESADGDA